MQAKKKCFFHNFVFIGMEHAVNNLHNYIVQSENHKSWTTWPLSTTSNYRVISTKTVMQVFVMLCWQIILCVFSSFICL